MKAGYQIALYSPIWKMFIKMNKNGTMACSPIVENGIFPLGWESEIFRVIEIKPNYFALWSPTWKMFIKMNKNGTMGCSPIIENGIFPSGWESEIFALTIIKPFIDENERKVIVKDEDRKRKLEEKEKEKALKLFLQETDRKLKLEAKEKERNQKQEEKEKIEKQHKLKSSRGVVFCIYCGSLEGTYSFCDGRKNGHNYVFMKDKKDRWHIKCNKCGADRSDSNYSCS
jgi:hypothetical protein